MVQLPSSYTVRRTTAEERKDGMPYITSSMLEAVNTCPRWGIVHSVLGKHFTSGYRQMALEAGSLMHEVLSVLNLYQVGVIQGFRDHMDYHGIQEFGADRWFTITKNNAPLDSSKPDFMQLEALMFNVVASSDYTDDPDDRTRTISNLEHCGMELASYWLRYMSGYNIYIADPKDMTAPIGTEMSVDVVFCPSDAEPFRFIGLVDAVYHSADGTITPGDYKTGRSLNDGWREALRTRHQFSAYWGALHAYFDADQLSDNFLVIGSSIPVTKTVQPVQHFPIYRSHQQVMDFIKTVCFTNQIISAYKHDPLAAPMFTHSCSRYFRPCSLLDLCDSERDDAQIMMEQMTIRTERSPSEMKALLQRE